MPHAKLNGASLYYDIQGDGPETILFLHGLLWSGKMFHKQVERFSEHFRCICLDHRGQGQSEVTADGYDIDNLYSDALGLMDLLKIDSCHVAGLSMGGFVGMRLAARNPDRVKSLILMETSADKEPFKLKYTFLTKVVNIFGVKSVTRPVMKMMFGKKFLRDERRWEERQKWIHELQQNDKTIIRSVNGVIHRKAILHELNAIKCPVLIMVGDQDIATDPSKAYQIAEKISQASVTIIKGAGHSSSIEEPEQVNTTIQNFLDEILIYSELD